MIRDGPGGPCTLRLVMLPPLLEVYVVWHPDDESGESLAQELIDHFHGTSFSGLIGGAVEIYVRSAPWREPAGSPRPLPCVEPLPYDLPAAEITAIVPVLGNGLAAAVQGGQGPWHDYLAAIAAAHDASPETVGVFPIASDDESVDGTVLGELLGGFQRIGSPDQFLPGDEPVAQRCRDLAQSIAQLAAGPDVEQLTVFISHTKTATGEEGDSQALKIDRVRDAVQHTRLAEYFDASDLQPGTDWAGVLQEKAATSALLGVRTDLYSSREWCQREIAVAKRAGMPVVILDALHSGEERGSFLMDHVPRVPGYGETGSIPETAIARVLNRLVDECLKRELWRRQRTLAGASVNPKVAWWAPHAPEPLTFVRWLREAHEAGNLPAAGPLRVLHPDPPLGRDEVATLREIAAISGHGEELEILTPRTLAARGG